MIELSEKELFSPFRKSSKGNQLKWRSGDWWYKADYLGYEGLKRRKRNENRVICES